MKYHMWLLNPQDSGQPDLTVADYLAIMNRALKLGINGTHYLRGFGQLLGRPKSITDIANIHQVHRALFRRFTSSGFVFVDGKLLPRWIKPSLCFYQWLSRSDPPATRSQFLIAANITASMHASMALDDWPAMTADQRDWVAALNNDDHIPLEPNWPTTPGHWSHAHPTIVEYHHYLAQPGDWIRARPPTFPPRTLVYDFKPSDSRATVLANCRELVLACQSTNSDPAFNGELVHHSITVAEIEKIL